MKKTVILSFILALSGCYSTVPPAQDVYVAPYTSPNVYYVNPQNVAQEVYTAPLYIPTATYVYEEIEPDVVYFDEPAYVYLDNPLIYGRSHHHHHHRAYAPRSHHHHKPHNLSHHKPHGHR